MSQNITESIAAARLLESRIIDAKAALALLEADLAEHEKVITAAVKAVAVKDEKGTLRGELVTEQGTAKITWPIAALKLTEANIADVKKLAGDAWSKLAERVPVSHSNARAWAEAPRAPRGKRSRSSDHLHVSDSGDYQFTLPLGPLPAPRWQQLWFPWRCLSR
jgi:hypothetical protein